MLETLINWYREPLFLLFPMAGLAISTGIFLILALPWTLLAWRDPVWARRYRIQDEPFAVHRYLGETLRRILVNNLIMLLLLVLAWPLLRLSGVHQGPLPGLFTILASLLFFVLLDDALYYWLHRWMHQNRWLLRHVHSVHHRVRHPSAIAGNHFHWLEFVLTGGLAMLGPLLLGSHVLVVWIWLAWRQWEAVHGHTGYHMPWDPGHWLPLYDGAAFHDFHHKRFHGNYAGFLPLWDRLLGTTVPDWRRRTVIPRTPSAKPG